MTQVSVISYFLSVGKQESRGGGGLFSAPGGVAANVRPDCSLILQLTSNLLSTLRFGV